MYSKSKGMTDRDQFLTPPPGYDGSRFRRRSDGRDDAFLDYSQKEMKVISNHPKKECRCEKEKETCVLQNECDGHPDCNEECDCKCECSYDRDDCAEGDCTSKKDDNNCGCEKPSGISAFLQSLGSEEILLIALILLLANDSKTNIDTVLILALLLCVS